MYFWDCLSVKLIRKQQGLCPWLYVVSVSMVFAALYPLLSSDKHAHTLKVWEGGKEKTHSIGSPSFTSVGLAWPLILADKEHLHLLEP